MINWKGAMPQFGRVMDDIPWWLQSPSVCFLILEERQGLCEFATWKLNVKDRPYLME